jgi:hypothetical protein
MIGKSPLLDEDVDSLLDSEESSILTLNFGLFFLASCAWSSARRSLVIGDNLSSSESLSFPFSLPDSVVSGCSSVF